MGHERRTAKPRVTRCKTVAAATVVCQNCSAQLQHLRPRASCCSLVAASEMVCRRSSRALIALTRPMCIRATRWIAIPAARRRSSTARARRCIAVAARVARCSVLSARTLAWRTSAAYTIASRRSAPSVKDVNIHKAISNWCMLPSTRQHGGHSPARDHTRRRSVMRRLYPRAASQLLRAYKALQRLRAIIARRSTTVIRPMCPLTQRWTVVACAAAISSITTLVRAQKSCVEACHADSDLSGAASQRRKCLWRRRPKSTASVLSRSSLSADTQGDGF